MGRGAAGVKGIELDDDDVVVGLAATDPERERVLAICERGYGKRTKLEEFRQQNRGGKGIILIDASDRNGPVVGIALVRPEDEVMLVTDRGQTIRTTVEEIRETGRNAQGVKVMSVDEGERVVAIEPVSDARVDDELGGEAPNGAEGADGDATGDDGSSMDVERAEPEDATPPDDDGGASGDGEPS
jgi:DNA gyrase subunit A